MFYVWYPAVVKSKQKYLLQCDQVAIRSDLIVTVGAAEQWKASDFGARYTWCFEAKRCSFLSFDKDSVNIVDTRHLHVVLLLVA